jgi:hypothetical protein
MIYQRSGNIPERRHLSGARAHTQRGAIHTNILRSSRPRDWVSVASFWVSRLLHFRGTASELASNVMEKHTCPKKTVRVGLIHSPVGLLYTYMNKLSRSLQCPSPLTLGLPAGASSGARMQSDETWREGFGGRPRPTQEGSHVTGDCWRDYWKGLSSRPVSAILAALLAG